MALVVPFIAADRSVRRRSRGTVTSIVRACVARFTSCVTLLLLLTRPLTCANLWDAGTRNAAFNSANVPVAPVC